MAIDSPRTIVAAVAALAASVFREASSGVPRPVLDGAAVSSDQISQPGPAARPAVEAA